MKKLLIALALTSPVLHAEEAPNLEQMWQIIQQQQAEIAALKAEIAENKKSVEQQNDISNQQADAIDTIAERVESSSDSKQSKYKFGGYGELHYNNTDKGNNIDLHRFVLFNGYQFNDKTSFYSEFEVEHALSGDGKPGEVEIEQAFIEHRISDTSKFVAGVTLLPVGILNETHEPDTFYGVERNNVEKNIIPATWWSAGLGFSQEVNSQFGYDLFIGDGLNVPVDGSSAFLIRSGRQKVAEAKANDGAVTLRARYNPNNNLQINASYQYQQDITQGLLGVDASLFEINARYQQGPFTLKALFANWSLNDKVTDIFAGREKQKGYFIEPSYRFGNDNQFGLFTRYSYWDNNAGDDNSSDAVKQTDFGMNYWLSPTVVFKADYQNQSGASDDDGFNLGVGYSF